MLKVIFKVIIVLLLVGYAAFFLSWNMAPQNIVSWNLFGTRYTQAMPVGTLGFAGLIIGAIIMALACWSAWATQRGLALKGAATIKKAKGKLQAQLDTINELRAENERLEAELESLQAGDGSWGRVAAGDLPNTPVAATAPSDDDEPVDDDEVI